MKNAFQFCLVSLLLICIHFSQGQNIFYAGQTSNTIYNTYLEPINNWYYDINGDLVFDLHVYTIGEPFGVYWWVRYYVEPMNGFKIAGEYYPQGDTIYPKDCYWGETGVEFAGLFYIGGEPVDGWVAHEKCIFAKNIVDSDTIYSWAQIGDTEEYLVNTASWIPCFDSIDIGIDTTIHHGDSIVLNAGEGYDYYLWNTGDTTESIIVNTEDFGTGTWTFSVVAGTNYCEYTDTITIVILTVKPVYFEDKLIVCSNQGNTGFTIKSLDGERIESVVLYNEIGQVILQEKPNNNIVNISNLKTGLYILTVSSKEWIARKKLVQQ